MWKISKLLLLSSFLNELYPFKIFTVFQHSSDINIYLYIKYVEGICIYIYVYI